MKMRIKQAVALVIEARNECNRLGFEAVAKLYGREFDGGRPRKRNRSCL